MNDHICSTKTYYWLSIRLINLDRYVETYSTRAKRFIPVLMPLQSTFAAEIKVYDTDCTCDYLHFSQVCVKSSLDSDHPWYHLTQLLLALSSSPGVLGRGSGQARPSLGSGAPSLRAAAVSHFSGHSPVCSRGRGDKISQSEHNKQEWTVTPGVYQSGPEVLEDQEGLDWVSDVEQLPVIGDWSGPEHVAEGHCQCCGLSSGHHYPATRLAPYSL